MPLGTFYLAYKSFYITLIISLILGRSEGGTEMKIIIKVKGGPGSGNYGHAGIPGSVGGSAPTSSVTLSRSTPNLKAGTYSSLGGFDTKPQAQRFIEKFTGKPYKIVTIEGNYIVSKTDDGKYHALILKPVPASTPKPVPASTPKPVPASTPKPVSIAKSGDSARDALQSIGSYEDFSKSKDKAAWVENAGNTIAKSVGLSTRTRILEDPDFTQLMAKESGAVLRKIGASPTQVRAVYNGGEDVMRFRRSSVENIRTSNDFRLFMMTVFHEMGHAYDQKVLGRKPESYAKGYDGSNAEEFADLFSSRVSIAHSAATTGNVDRILRNGITTFDEYIRRTSL